MTRSINALVKEIEAFGAFSAPEINRIDLKSKQCQSVQVNHYISILLYYDFH